MSPQANDSEADPAPDSGADTQDPYWWAPLATVVGFLAIANYVWLSFL